MPIGVPRIIYCWGEELPAQWTDIYNFIFRRRMVFLMQYLDDELCNQICGLLINIHMEDRSKEMEKKDIEKSGMFKNPTKQISGSQAKLGESQNPENNASKKNVISNFYEDLLKAENDLGINDNYLLEQKTLQKITMDWLNWNTQFVDYKSGTSNPGDSATTFKSDINSQPYFFYLAEILSKDFSNKDAQFFYNLMFDSNQTPGVESVNKNLNFQNGKSLENVYSPFRFLANLENTTRTPNITYQQQQNFLKNISSSIVGDNASNLNIFSKDFLNSFKQFYSNSILGGHMPNASTNQTELALACNLLNLENQQLTDLKTKQLFSQRQLKREYVSQSNVAGQSNKNKLLNYLNTDPINSYTIFNSSNDFSQKDKSANSYAINSQLSQAYQEEEAKKVFMIINSFGGSVGNGITVHDALQFIKAGSMTLALGVAASAASLALAGGTIGERYVTEGCHVMIHQPEGGLSGQASDIWIDSLEIMKIRMDVAEIYSLSTYRPRHKILRDLDRDYYLSATDAIQYGLCDEIATNEVMHSIIELTSKVWDYHDTKQQRLLESREGANSDLNTQTQN